MEIVKSEKAAPTEAPKPVVKPIKFRVEDIVPASIVDVWRLYSNSLKLSPPVYPAMDEEDPEMIRARLFQMSSSQGFIGVIAKHGKKPIGQILSNVMMKPFGQPKVYLYVGITWVDPAYRKIGVGDQLVKEVFRRAKAKGVHYFEGISEPGRTDEFLKLLKGNGKLVAHVVSGKTTQG